jgi:NDP-4-keto-2,6-dideoxyhexose 3-C-methyltransferase
MKVTKITRCRICGNPHLVPVIDLGTQVLSGRFPKSDEKDPPAAPLELVRCDISADPNACGLTQLHHSVTQDELYKCGYGYLSGINQTMRDHLKGIAETANEMVSLQKNDVILDIGSNDGTLLKQYNIPANIHRVGMDPGGEQYRMGYPDNIRLISDYFTAENYQKFYWNRNAKIITSVAMFYDLEDPQDFMRDVKNVLHPEGIWIMEQSYLPSMLATNSFDTICHEHLEYYSLYQIYWMVKNMGLRIVDVEFNKINGGSFRVYICHQDALFKSNVQKIITTLVRERDEKPDVEFKLRVEGAKRKVMDFLKAEREKGAIICLYGASTKGNVLLQYFGADNKLITAAAERNSKKWGCVTPGTRIPILSEADVRKLNPDYMLVLPWHFKEEFIQRELKYLQNGGKFIFPLPKFEVV